MNDAVYFITPFVVFVIITVIACCAGLCVRRQRAVAAANAEQHYAAFVGQSNSNTNSGFTPDGGQGGNYVNLDYQQHQWPPQVGVVTGPGTGYYYPTGSPPGRPGNPPGGPALPATVLYAAPSDSQAPNINFGNYFPEAQVVNSNTNNNSAFATTSPDDISPYGEADYVSCPPPPVSHTQRPPSSPGPIPAGTAALPPPRYAAAPAAPVVDNANGKRKELS